MKLVIAAIKGLAWAGAMAACIMAGPVMAQKKYDPGASDTEIKIGNIMAYSGPASAYGTIGKVQAAYFRMINDQGGVNGRKINFISYDDGYSPPKAVEQARKLVESDEVLFIFNSLGTPGNTAIQKYMNTRKVPQLFVATGATKFGDAKNFPWTIGWQPSYQTEGRIYAKYILDNHRGSKIAVLYQNDDYGKDVLQGVKDGLGNHAAMIVAEAQYETTAPTIDSQIINLKGTGADIFINITTPKFAAQAIRKMAELNWKPVHILNNVSTSVGAVLKPAGIENSQGILSSIVSKDPTDKNWQNDPAMKEWVAFMDKHYPEGDKTSGFNAYGYMLAQTLVHVLKRAGDVLTRENIMRQATSMTDVELGLLLPGVKLNTSATDYYPLKQLQMMRLKGESWEPFGPVLTGEVGG